MPTCLILEGDTETMNKEGAKFWITCPHCKQKFGIDPKIIIKYADRLINRLESKIQERAKEIRDAGR